jgi:hypothetical protein
MIDKMKPQAFAWLSVIAIPFFAIHAANSTPSFRRTLRPLNAKLSSHHKAAMAVTFLLIRTTRTRPPRLADMEMNFLLFMIRSKNDPSKSCAGLCKSLRTSRPGFFSGRDRSLTPDSCPQV